jgi:hypothetical protein
MMIAKSLMTMKCTLSAGHFDGHGGPPVRYEVHPLIQHVQAYTRSHWMPPFGNCLLRIAPVAARATANKTTTKTHTHFAGLFDGCGGAPVQYCMHCPMEVVQGFTKSHWTASLGK